MANEIESAFGELVSDIKKAGSLTDWANDWGREVGIGGITVKEPDSERPWPAGYDDDLDAFRHAFTSAVLSAWGAMAAGGNIATSRQITDWLGQLNEVPFLGGRSAAPCSRAMDLHNNQIGRELAPDSVTMLRWIMSGENPHRKIAEIIAGAVRSGQLITRFDDPRMPRECYAQTKMKGHYYVWRTKRDDKVRWQHAVRNGQVFRWDTPPSGGHPGQDFGCRCWAEPLDPNFEKSIEADSSLKKKK